MQPHPRNLQPTEAAMAAIKIHLETAESDAVERLATLMGVKPEEIGRAHV